MRLLKLSGSLLLPLVLAQSSSSASRTASDSSSSGSSASAATVLTTTITSFVASGSTSQPTTLLRTLTQNVTASSTAPIANATATSNGTLANSTAGTANATANTTALAWNSTDDWLPFNVTLDPAYGVAGALLITTGLPVAALGGKNRWSSLAIATGYSLSLFTLVLILSLGVEPAIQPPSPNPPTTAMRGLYLLACAIACMIGSGLGVFFFNIARHWIGAVGGFAFGWFLLATKAGGLVDTIAGRWGLIGGMSVAWLLACIVPVLTPYAVLVSTAWAGATAFVLGIDCYTRAGLKEFYVYNLGYHDLFPSLDGQAFPLTQTMQVELGVIAATALIGGAIQFRVVNVLQKRLKQMREEEEARIEAEQVAQAAERFKNVEADLSDWEKKHGDVGGSTPSGSMTLADRSSVLLPTLSYQRKPSLPSLVLQGDDRGDYATVRQEVDTPTPTLPAQDRTSLFDELGLKSPEPALTSPTTPTDPELESQMRLLEEVRRTRAEIRRSMDQLRSATPTSGIDPRMSMSSARLLDERPSTDRRYSQSATSQTDARRLSINSASQLDTRRLSTTSSRLLDVDRARSPTALRFSPELLADRRTPSPKLADAGPPRSDWDAYVAERKLVRPKPTIPHEAPRSSSMYHTRVSDFGPGAAPAQVSQTAPSRPVSQVDRGFASRPSSYLIPSPPNSAPIAPVITGSASRPQASSSRPTSQQFPRTMTYDELAERHRSRISRLQEPVTSQMREHEDVARARRDWEAKKKAESAEMSRREQDKAARRVERKEVPGSAEVAHDRPERVRLGERMKSTDEWRRSVSGLDQVAAASKPEVPRRSDKRQRQAWAS
ncbi:hypothetical protein Q5752_002388 [Cryptotrichosporon argae]